MYFALGQIWLLYKHTVILMFLYTQALSLLVSIETHPFAGFAYIDMQLEIAFFQNHLFRRLRWEPRTERSTNMRKTFTRPLLGALNRKRASRGRPATVGSTQTRLKKPNNYSTTDNVSTTTPNN
jgi:hypothetical protein